MREPTLKIAQNISFFPFLTHVNLQIIAPKITVIMTTKYASLRWKSINTKSLSYYTVGQQQNQTLTHINSPNPHMQAHPITMNQMWALHVQRILETRVHQNKTEDIISNHL